MSIKNINRQTQQLRSARPQNEQQTSKARNQNQSNPKKAPQSGAEQGSFSRSAQATQSKKKK